PLPYTTLFRSGPAGETSPSAMPAPRTVPASEAVVAVQQPPQPAQHGTFAAILAAGLRRGGEHAPGHARERQRLQPHRARAGERGQEHAFAAEQHALDPADSLDVHVDAGVERDHAAGVDVDAFARGELALHHRAAGVHEHPAVAFELLHDEALAAEQAGEDLALEVDADRHAACAGQEAVLLADQASAVVG